MFYYSVFPAFYLFLRQLQYPQLPALFRFCFHNEISSAETLENWLGKTWIAAALEANLLTQKDGGYKLNFSLLPFDNYMIVRDPHSWYRFHELDSNKPQNRVWVGSDSVKFAEMNRRHLAGRSFEKTLELGCGSGIQLLAVAHLSKSVKGIDINPRAVESTNLTMALNGLSAKIQASESDLFAGLAETYDLILANPWFIDIEKGGLEEIPSIISELDNYLNQDGYFTMYFSSFVKQGVDQGKTVMNDFAETFGYEAHFWNLGKSLEPAFLDAYKQHGISHINTYYAVLKKTGTYRMKEYPAGFFRQIRDSIFLPLQRILYSKS